VTDVTHLPCPGSYPTAAPEQDYPRATMTADEAIALLQELWHLHGYTPELATTQIQIFRGCWQGQTYTDIARELGYSPEYLRQVGSGLWRTIAELTGRRTTKGNLRAVLEPFDGSRSSRALVPGCDQPVAFYGRAVPLAVLERALSDPGVVLLRGLAGTGKTLLAAALLDRMRDRVARTLWHDLTATPDFVAFTETVRALPPATAFAAPSDEDACLAWLSQRLHDSPCLLVLDSYEALATHPDRDRYAKLLQHLSRTAACSVLAVGREPPSLPTAAEAGRDFVLGGWQPSVADRFLQERLAVPSAQLQRLRDRYACHPLALTRAVGAVDAGDRAIDELLGDRGSGPFEPLEQQYRALSADEQRVLTWLARNPPTLASVLAMRWRGKLASDAASVISSLQASCWLSVREGVCRLEPIAAALLRDLVGSADEANPSAHPPPARNASHFAFGA